MEVCNHHQNDDTKQRHVAPAGALPVVWGQVGPVAVNYPFLMQDAMIIGMLHALTGRTSDNLVRRAPHAGVADGLRGWHDGAGPDDAIHTGPPR